MIDYIIKWSCNNDFNNWDSIVLILFLLYYNFKWISYYIPIVKEIEIKPKYKNLINNISFEKRETYIKKKKHSK